MADQSEFTEWDLGQKRFKKRVRRDKKKLDRLRALALSNQKFKQRGFRSLAITRVAEAYAGKPVQTRRSLHLSFPATFSVIENPTGVLETIGRFAKTIRSKRLYEVTFDQSKIARYDVAAESLVDLIADELISETRYFRKQTRFRGYYPRDATVKRFVRSMGLIKHLEISHEDPEPGELEKIRLFDFRNRDYPWADKKPEQADTKSKTIAKFVDHINDCIKDNGRALTSLSVQKLCAYVGEILDNVSEHSGMYDWTVAGYLDNSAKEPICEIAIFNLGKTIAETLQEMSENSYTRRQIAPYIDRHSSKNWFGQGWRVEDLFTLVALQGHISRKNESPADTRGQGTVDLIEFFQKVHSECTLGGKGTAAKMAILSGSTHILFDGSYEIAADSEGRKRIAFNAENDLNVKPDGSYVRALNGYFFPGTVISIRFPLQPTSTKPIENKP